MASDVWTCSSCGSLVPGRVRQCRCGAEAPQAHEEPDRDRRRADRIDQKLWSDCRARAVPAPVRCTSASGGHHGAVSRARLRPSPRPARKPTAAAPGLRPTPTTPNQHQSPGRRRACDRACVTLDADRSSPTSAASSSAAAPAHLAEAGTGRSKTSSSRASAAVVGIETSSGPRHRLLRHARTAGHQRARRRQGNSVVTVRLAGGQTSQGRVERSSPDVDLAVVRTSARADEMQILQLGSSTRRAARTGSPGDRLAARPSEHGHARHRQRGPERRRRRADSNRCGDQSGQQRRSAAGPRRPRHRRDHAEALARR